MEEKAIKENAILTDLIIGAVQVLSKKDPVFSMNRVKFTTSAYNSSKYTNNLSLIGTLIYKGMGIGYGGRWFLVHKKEEILLGTFKGKHINDSN